MGGYQLVLSLHSNCRSQHICLHFYRFYTSEISLPLFFFPITKIKTKRWSPCSGNWRLCKIQCKWEKTFTVPVNLNSLLHFCKGKLLICDDDLTTSCSTVFWRKLRHHPEEMERIHWAAIHLVSYQLFRKSIPLPCPYNLLCRHICQTTPKIRQQLHLKCLQAPG